MDKHREVWVFAEKVSAVAELLAAGRSLGVKVVALVPGEPDQAGKYLQQGADAVYCLGEPTLVEDVTETILEQITAKKPGLLLVYASKRGKLIAGRLAAVLKVTVMTDIRAIQFSGEAFQGVHMLYGGGAVRTERSSSATTIATVGAGTFQPLALDPSRSGDVMRLSPVQPANYLRLVERRKKLPSAVNLHAAKRVIGVGRGLARQEDLSMVENLAHSLGAEIACTRPISEGLNWLPRERYLGVSGAVIKPDLYLALGVSGQIQHMFGVLDARCIVAINKDKNAPVFQQADYGIIGDLYKVVPALISLYEKMK